MRPGLDPAVRKQMRAVMLTLSGAVTAALLPQQGLAQTGAGPVAPEAPAAPAGEALPTISMPQAAPQDSLSAVPRSSSSRLVEEIIVTAQKREENIQDVPISIAAFSAEALDARGVSNVKDLAIATPGLQFTDLAGYTLIYLRGVGTDAFIPSAEPSIATYVDGVYFPSAHSLGQAFGALERVEVLKGPQGTLFGRNSTGGAINVITREPGQTPETELQASYGRFSDLKTRIYTSLPITDTLAASVSLIYNSATPYYRRESDDGRSLLSDTTRGVRAKLHWSPLDDFDIRITGILLQQNGSTGALTANTHPTPLGSLLGIQPETREYVTTDDSFPSLRISTKALYGQSNLKLDSFDIKLIASYYDVIADDYTYDFDGSSRPLVTFQAYPEFQNIKTAELQFTSNAGSWRAEQFKWVGGLYRFESRGGYDPAYLSVANSAVQLPTGQLLSLLPQSLLDLLGPIPAPNSVGLYFRGLLGTESTSAYLQGSYSLTDWASLTLGGRYQRERRELLVSNVEVDNFASTAPGVETTPLIVWTPQRDTESNFSPRVSLEVHLRDDVMTYLSYSKGFKSATYNIVNIYAPPQFVKPENVSAYELGLKADFLDRNLRFNAAVFQTDIKDLQTAFVSLTSGGAVSFQNAGKAQIRGAEFDATWTILPELDPGLVLTSSASLLHAVYTDYQNGQGYDETTGLAFKGRDFSGNRIVRTPNFTGTVGLSQTIDTQWGPFEIGGDYYYNNGFYFLAQNSPESYEPAYGVVNARLSFLYQPWDFRITLYGSNLTDERYNVQQFMTDFGREDQLAPPISYGIRLNWKF